ncbi:MAG: PHP domain-containing protein [Elusimicrobia bacterium]|nr:PHP domain-containing protein [Elusimicrobiota bacterium]
MAKNADLHCHSRRSDGSLEPAEVVRRAHKAGIALLVLSDHDSVSGFPEARVEAARLGMDFACGIEINTGEADGVHVLGYGFDPYSAVLAGRLEEFRARRERRAGIIVERLNALGVELTLEEVRGESTETLGRPHVADALRRKKLVKDRAEAFKRYLVPGAAAYVAPMGPTVAEAIAAIKGAGGWASLAHPGTVKRDIDLAPWVEQGLEGIEAYYKAHTGPQIDRFLEAAKRFGLLATGGSDFHGPGTGREDLGGVEIPDAELAVLRERLRVAAPA